MNGPQSIRLPIRFARFASSRRGGATVEFVIVFPMFLLLFLVCFETSMLFTRQLMLERALDLTMRDVRLSTGETFPAVILRRSICERALILPACDDSLALEITRVDRSTYATPSSAAACVDRGDGAEAPDTIQDGSPDEMMLVRACFTVAPFFPTIGLGLELVRDTNGEMQLTTASAFVQEPGTGSGGGS